MVSSNMVSSSSISSSRKFNLLIPLSFNVSLTYKLLRFINSAVYGFRVTIRSIRHALILLGKREIRKWLTLIALSGIGSDKPLELLHNTLVRARFCELIGQDLKKVTLSAEYTEPADWQEVARLSVHLQLPQANLVNHYIESVHWVRDF